MQRLKVTAEKPKSSCLSRSRPTNLPYITADATGPKHMNIKVTQSETGKLVEDRNRSIEPLKVALQDVGLSGVRYQRRDPRWRSGPGMPMAEKSG